LTKVFVTLLGLICALHNHLAPPAVIRQAHSDSAPGELCPLCPHSLHPCAPAPGLPIKRETH